MWGPPGSGKTHLLHRWARGAGGRVLDAPDLRGLPRLPDRPLAVDDADAAIDEAALLHLLNAAAEARLPVLLAGRDPPGRWAVRLPDLGSRLRATAAAGLGLPDDALLRALLRKLLSDRQLEVAAPVRDWLLARLPRTAAALREAAARLDRAALAAGGRVTRPLAAAVLADMTADAGEEVAMPDATPSPSGPALL